MKTTTFKLAVLLVLPVLAIFTSCKKPSDSKPGSFTWAYNGTNYTANIKAAYLYSMSVGPIIIAGTGSTLVSSGTGPNISVNSLGVGSYYCGSGSTNYLRYVDANGDVLYSDSGSLNITVNANSLLSGNFSGTVLNTTGASIPITLFFTNIPIEN